METKKCGKCGLYFPKTGEYFFKKIVKWKTKKGMKTNYSYRSTCKKCHTKIHTEKRRAKRIEELNCTPETYRDAYIKDQTLKMLKYEELYGLTEAKRNYIRRKIDKGYKYKGLEQYEIDKRETANKRRLRSRKYKYDHDGIITQKESNAMQMLHITKSRIANMLRIKTSELPDEIYEVMRTTRQLKRELGLTHSSHPHLNINKKQPNNGN